MSSVAIERAMILLRYIMENDDGLSVREASRQFGYNPATVQKIINALKSQGFVVQNEVTERYYLGPDAIRLGLVALSRLDIKRIARVHLEEINQVTDETVFLAIPAGNYAVYIDKEVSNQAIRMDAPLGVYRPYNCTAVGKVLLTDFVDEEIEILFRAGAFEKRTDNSIIEVDQLKEELGRVRERGWAIDNEEFSLGARCLAVPIFNHQRKVLAALTVSGPADRVGSQQEKIIQILKDHAKQISEKLGFGVPQVA